MGPLFSTPAARVSPCSKGEARAAGVSSARLSGDQACGSYPGRLAGCIRADPGRHSTPGLLLTTQHHWGGGWWGRGIVLPPIPL